MITDETITKRLTDEMITKRLAEFMGEQYITEAEHDRRYWEIGYCYVDYIIGDHYTKFIDNLLTVAKKLECPISLHMGITGWGEDLSNCAQIFRRKTADKSPIRALALALYYEIEDRKRKGLI